MTCKGEYYESNPLARKLAHYWQCLAQFRLGWLKGARGTCQCEERYSLDCQGMMMMTTSSPFLLPQGICGVVCPPLKEYGCNYFWVVNTSTAQQWLTHAWFAYIALLVNLVELFSFTAASPPDLFTNSAFGEDWFFWYRTRQFLFFKQYRPV